MGGGSYEREVIADTSGCGSSAAASALAQRHFHDDCKPMQDGQRKAVATDSETPIVIALDVSGSMAEWPRIFYDKLPMLYGQLLLQGYISDPAISFSMFSGGSPLQVTPFISGIQIDDWLKKMFLCGGGTSPAEPYIDVAYFYGHEAVQLSATKGKPYFFITGDQAMHDEARERGLPDRVRQQIDPLPDAKFNAGPFNADGMPADGTWDKVLIWQSLMKKYHVFHVQKPGSNLAEWSKILGPERVLKLTTAKASVDCILGAIALTSGARTLDEYVEDLKERGQDEVRRNEIRSALSPYWQSIRINCKADESPQQSVPAMVAATTTPASPAGSTTTPTTKLAAASCVEATSAPLPATSKAAVDDSQNAA